MGFEAFLSRPRGGWMDAGEAGFFHIGLVNNMPDSALESTERQFSRLLSAAAPELRIRWHLFSLGGIARGEAGHLHLVRQYYGGLHDLYRTPVQALIVTGTEPKLPDLRQEAYWPEFTGLLDWIEREGPPAIFSCLAAHGAVLHFDGIARRRLTEKHFGLFEHAAATDHPLAASVAAPVRVAHSRWHDVAADALADAGYSILTHGAEAGVDLFAKRKRHELLFLQGHAEYDANTLAREYRRDVRRFLAGIADIYPELPKHYFAANDVPALECFRERARNRRDVALMNEFPLGATITMGGAPTATIFGAWLRNIEANRAERYGACERRSLAGALAS